MALALMSLIDPAKSSPPKYLQWGDKCKKQPLRPTESCDINNGLRCQPYLQGYYCGCEIDSIWSYDRQSKECRLKVATECFYDPESSVVDELPFGSKCHEWADCVKPNWTTITGKSQDTRVCQCKSGYIPNKDFSECEPIKIAGSASFITITTFVSAIIPIILVLL